MLVQEKRSVYLAIELSLKEISYVLYVHALMCSGLFCKFFGDFGVYFEIVFLKGLVQLMEKGNFDDLLLFKIRIYMRLKIGRCTPNGCPPTWGTILGAVSCLVVFHNLFSPFLNSSLNFLKFHLNSGKIPP